MAEHPEVFSQVFSNLIRAGEASGQLPEVLANLSDSLKWEDELASHTKKLLMYPAFVATIVLAATFFLMIYMVPQLKVFVRNMGQTLPLHTQVLFFVSDLLVDYWYLFLATPLVAGLIGLQLVRTNPLARLRFDGIKLRLPVLGPILNKIILSRFASTFAMLYASGIPSSSRSAPPSTSSATTSFAAGWSGSSNRSARAQRRRRLPRCRAVPAAGRPHAAHRRKHRRPRQGTAQRQLLLQPRRQGIGEQGANPDRTDADPVHGRPARLDHAVGDWPDLRRHQ
jgi:hypothetical protein